MITDIDKTSKERVDNLTYLYTDFFDKTSRSTQIYTSINGRTFTAGAHYMPSGVAEVVYKLPNNKYLTLVGCVSIKDGYDIRSISMAESLKLQSELMEKALLKAELDPDVSFVTEMPLIIGEQKTIAQIFIKNKIRGYEPI